ncbi:phosphatidylserine decarboxylase [Bacillus sp. T33-2]|uniref:phosphatidylserine decarboxylase n=1 Tax=Bacillus sp. T33-2 TaxID=2054168 RepID=UPI000C755B81|nr:phosphatidylserine decarboxylase [Bacillus sp. T33-2]PLR93786.1 phosphatidylserine decarboxylase [Bacillus sp. T33-2]
MIQNLYRLFIELTNGRWSSSALKRFARSKASKTMVPSFAKIYRINVAEMEKPLHEYPTLHDFFIRKLKEGARLKDGHPAAVLSPVDAVIEDIGTVRADQRITVKGKVYSIAEMLGSPEATRKYEDGTYVILYLSPSHYHRIHSPVSGTVVNRWTLGTKSYPVNRMGLKYGDRPLSKNFRTITEVHHGKGHVAIVKVGAMFVNSIETVHEGEQLTRGEEMAYFSFGSTVVLLFEKDSFQLLPGIMLPTEIKVGEKIGFIGTGS